MTPIAKSEKIEGFSTSFASLQKDLQTKSGHVWKCIKKEKDNESSGFIYTFELKRCYDLFAPTIQQKKENLERFRQKQQEIFPVLERNYDSFVAALSSDEIDLGYVHVGSDSPRHFNYTADLQKLGYFSTKNYQGKEGYYFSAPDKIALVERWQKFQLKKLNLPSLRIADFEQSEGEEVFIEKCLNHHLVLGNDHSFCHDQLIHALTTIDKILFLSSQNKNVFFYSMIKAEKQREIFQEQLHLNDLNAKVKEEKVITSGPLPNTYLELVQVLLSIKTEILTLDSDFEYEQLDKEYLWFCYLNKRFPKLLLSITTASALMKKVNQFYQSKEWLSNSVFTLDFSDLPRAQTVEEGLSFLNKITF